MIPSLIALAFSAWLAAWQYVEFRRAVRMELPSEAFNRLFVPNPPKRPHPRWSYNCASAVSYANVVDVRFL